jgi:uncharacterized damage-inducible protein DinB
MLSPCIVQQKLDEGRDPSDSGTDLCEIPLVTPQQARCFPHPKGGKESVMETKEFFLSQLEREQAPSLKALEQVPTDKPDYKPHEKSMPLGYLSVLVAQMPAWISAILTTDGLDFSDKNSGVQFRKEPAKNTDDLIRLATESYEKAKAALEVATDKQLDAEWALKMGGKELMKGTRRNQIADTFTHLAHHRGQLTVYLRLNDRTVPAIYGPSADEKVG